MISSKLQAIGGFYLLPSILGTFFKIWAGWSQAALFLDVVPFPGLLVLGFCLQIIER